MTITSGLAGFCLVQRISEVSDRRIRGETTFNKAPLYAGLEAMAQLGALDVRRRIDFGGHAFLLKIIRCRWPSARDLDGCFALQAIPGSQSLRAFVYRTRALGPGDLELEAELMFGTVDYDHQFQEEHLQSHYRKLFACLQNATTAN